MGNPRMITREMIELFVQSNAFLKNINSQFDEFRSDLKVGSQLHISLPNNFTNGLML